MPHIVAVHPPVPPGNSIRFSQQRFHPLGQRTGIIEKRGRGNTKAFGDTNHRPRNDRFPASERIERIAADTGIFEHFPNACISLLAKRFNLIQG